MRNSAIKAAAPTTVGAIIWVSYFVTSRAWSRGPKKAAGANGDSRGSPFGRSSKSCASKGKGSGPRLGDEVDRLPPDDFACARSPCNPDFYIPHGAIKSPTGVSASAPVRRLRRIIGLSRELSRVRFYACLPSRRLSIRYDGAIDA